MAFFKFRKGGDDSPAAAPQAESVEVLRRRARHRLIGAAVLVLLGVVGFPLLFDTQPRPVAVDIPIQIPDRNKVKPLPAPVATAAPAVQARASEAVAAVKPASAPAAGRPMASGTVTAAPLAEARPEAKTEAPPQVAARAEAVARPEAVVRPPTSSKAPPLQQAKAEPAARPADAARAQALLEGKPAQTATQDADGRFVVQVGAFADASKARETRLRVEKTGLKTYTHVAETREGRRIRVRVGPFATRAEADKAAARIKQLDLPAAILTL